MFQTEIERQKVERNVLFIYLFPFPNGLKIYNNNFEEP